MDDTTVISRCMEMQDEEIATLEAIYPDQIASCPTFSGDSTRHRSLKLRLPITLASEVSVNLISSPARRLPIHRETDVAAAVAGPSSAMLKISHLPPILIDVALPSSYPISARPVVSRISASLPDQEANTSWLSRQVLATITNKLGALWDEERDSNSTLGEPAEGVGVLWRWWEWVANGEFLQELGMLQDNTLSLTVPPSMPSSTFFTALNRYNAQQIHSSFESTAFACAICFESRKGKKCAQMPCGCVFCHSCLHACWTLAISEGTLEAVSCPDPGCVKKRATKTGGQLDETQDGIDAALVESVVGKDPMERWVELKARRRAEIDPSYCICPRPDCQAPVPPPAPPSASSSLHSTANVRTIRLADLSASSSRSSAASPISPVTPASPVAAIDDRWDRYRQCPSCSYSFCMYCSATWHGAHTPCSFPQTSALVLEYLSYHEGSVERARMEQRRGKKNIDRMVAKYLEEEENKKWLDERTRACAGCGVRVEKSHGCNHMTCGRCGAHFCYRCGVSIKPSDPYEHYRRPGSSCFEKLFDQEEIARFERETAIGQAGMGHLYGDEWAPRGIWEW